jgi:hypothetical protein
LPIKSYIDRARSVAAGLRSLAPKRPTVIVQSDDWGRVGVPSLDALERLRVRHPNIGRDSWDFYGLESEEDIVALGDVLAETSDKDGRPACFTANFIMANADLRAMRAHDYGELRWIGIVDGFPAPWTDRNFSSYRFNIERKAFYPGLHGFTHFNIPGLLHALRSTTREGAIARELAAEDTPYLASLTPEYNFALLARGQEDRFLDAADQSYWIKQGVALFLNAFGFSPRTTCAPGYRANDTTFLIWNEVGIEIVQTRRGPDVDINGSLLVLRRNVDFEPALQPDGSVAAALAQAQAAVARGSPIIVCTHSINYVSRHLGRAQQSRAMLREFLGQLLKTFPDLRFASDVEFADAYMRQDAGWFRPATVKEQAQRMSLFVRRNQIARMPSVAAAQS